MPTLQLQSSRCCKRWIQFTLFGGWFFLFLLDTNSGTDFHVVRRAQTKWQMGKYLEDLQCSDGKLHSFGTDEKWNGQHSAHPFPHSACSPPTHSHFEHEKSDEPKPMENIRIWQKKCQFDKTQGKWENKEYNNIWRATAYHVNVPSENVRAQCACAAGCAIQRIPSPVKCERETFKWKTNSTPGRQVRQVSRGNFRSHLVWLKFLPEPKKKMFFRVTERRDICVWVRYGENMRRRKMIIVHIAARCLRECNYNMCWNLPSSIFKFIVLFNAWPSPPQCHDERHLKICMQTNGAKVESMRFG